MCMRPCLAECALGWGVQITDPNTTDMIAPRPRHGNFICVDCSLTGQVPLTDTSGMRLTVANGTWSLVFNTDTASSWNGAWVFGKWRKRGAIVSPPPYYRGQCVTCPEGSAASADFTTCGKWWCYHSTARQNTAFSWRMVPLAQMALLAQAVLEQVPLSRLQHRRAAVTGWCHLSEMAVLYMCTWHCTGAAQGGVSNGNISVPVAWPVLELKCVFPAFCVLLLLQWHQPDSVATLLLG
jgi:hypothetical protein